MTTEELNEALSDEAVYARRKTLLDALIYEMDLLDKAMTAMEAIDAQTINMMTENQVDKMVEDKDAMEEAHRELDDAHTDIIQSLPLHLVNRYNEDTALEVTSK